MSMKQSLKSLDSREEDKKFLQNAGYSLRYCLPWQFRPLYCILERTRSRTGGGKVSVSGILVEEMTEILCAM